MDISGQVAAYVKQYREEIEPHWSEDLLYAEFVAPPGVSASAGYCGPSSIILWLKLRTLFPSEEFSLAVGRVYKNSTELIIGKHVWIAWHQKLKGAMVIDVTADQSRDVDEKVVVEDINVLAARGVNYIAYRLAQSLSQVDESSKRRAKMLGARLGFKDYPWSHADSIESELIEFLKEYESASNSHVWKNVEPFIAANATYWFTDGTYEGIEEIRHAVEATFAKIQDEVYEIRNIRWPLVADGVAVCTYTFFWKGTIDGIASAGSGKGTNVLKKTNGSWQIIHEHLSSDN